MIPAQHAFECADVVTSSDDYARRFSGDIGAWLVSRQSALTQQMLSTFDYQTALDVGGGHGQLIGPLVKMGIKVTVLGSESSCKRQIELNGDQQRCIFVVGNLTEIPFETKSFDLVTCIRFISHCEQWPQLISELCRVAKRGVFIDYPPLISANLLAPVTFRIKRLIEGNTRPFSIFRHREIEREFNRHGFFVASRKGQFLLPMAIHRLVKRRAFSERIEQLSSSFGLDYSLGSPTLAHFVRGN